MTRKALQALLLASIAACTQAPPADAQSADAAVHGDRGGELLHTRGRWTSCPGSGVAHDHLALVTEKEGKLWLVDTASGNRQAVSGVPAVKVAGQGGLGDVVAHPDFAGNQRDLSDLRRGRPERHQRRGARVRPAGHGPGRAAARGLQDHLAADAKGHRQRPFRAPHRVCARRDDFPQLGRPAEDAAGAGPRTATSARSST